MKTKPIIITSGDQKSIFFEIFFKSLKKKIKSPIILISSLELLISNMKKYKFRKKIKIVNLKSIKNENLSNNSINIVNTDDFQIGSKKNIDFIKKCFELSLKILKTGVTNKFINGPINKETFLRKSYPGITEYIARKTKTKEYAMLIYNKNLSVCPITTHIPLKRVNKLITKKLIVEKVRLINSFYKKVRKIKPKIGVTGLNPHCESTDKYNEDVKIIKPTINYLKKQGYKISGPIPADTIFLKNNRENYDVILGMYHDQVLSPIKTLFEFNAINITLGLKFMRVSPDHGPNLRMVGKNMSSPTSLISAINFFDKY